jgi:hypothetical protein
LHFDLQYDGETELDVSLIRGNEYFLSEYLDDWIMDQDWFDASLFYLSALDTAADSNLGRSVILPLLQGSLNPKIDYAKYERARLVNKYPSQVSKSKVSKTDQKDQFQSSYLPKQGTHSSCERKSISTRS